MKKMMIGAALALAIVAAIALVPGVGHAAGQDGGPSAVSEQPGCVALMIYPPRPAYCGPQPGGSTNPPPPCLVLPTYPPQVYCGSHPRSYYGGNHYPYYYGPYYYGGFYGRYYR